MPIKTLRMLQDNMTAPKNTISRNTHGMPEVHGSNIIILSLVAVGVGSLGDAGFGRLHREACTKEACNMKSASFSAHVGIRRNSCHS